MGAKINSGASNIIEKGTPLPEETNIEKGVPVTDGLGAARKANRNRQQLRAQQADNILTSTSEKKQMDDFAKLMNHDSKRNTQTSRSKEKARQESANTHEVE